MSDENDVNGGDGFSPEDFLFKLDFQEKLKEHTNNDFEFDNKDISKLKDIFIKNNKDLDLEDYDAVLNTYNQYTESLKEVVSEPNKAPDATVDTIPEVNKTTEKVDDDEFDFDSFTDDYKFSNVEDNVVEPPQEDEVTRMKRELQAELDELKEFKRQLASDKKSKEEAVEESKVEKNKTPKVEDVVNIEEFTEADLDVFIKSLVDVEPEKAAAAFKKKLKAESDKAKKLEEKLSKIEEQMDPAILETRFNSLLEKRKQEEESNRVKEENQRIIDTIEKSKNNFLKTKEARFVLRDEDDISIFNKFLENNQAKMIASGEDLSKLHEKTFINLMSYKKKIRGVNSAPRVETPSTPTAADVQGGGFSSQKTSTVDLEKEFGIVSNKKFKYI